MNKKKLAAVALFGVICILLNVIIITSESGLILGEYSMHIGVGINSEIETDIQLYYSTDKEFGENSFAQDRVESDRVAAGVYETADFDINATNTLLRIDFSDKENVKTVITGLSIDLNSARLELNEKELKETIIYINQAELNEGTDGLSFLSEGTDAFIVLDLEGAVNSVAVTSANSSGKMCIKIVICIIIDLMYIWFIKKREQVFGFFYDIVTSRHLILRLAKNDLKGRFAGSYLGVIWSFIQPIVTVLVYWFVFQVGLRNSDVATASGQTVPFILWFIAGLVPWFFYSDTWNVATNVLLEYSYLVKKVVFNIDMLPIVKMLSGFIIHCFFVGFMLILYMCYGMLTDVTAIQIVYYSFCMFVLVLGQAYLTSACTLFFRDLTQVINIWMQIGVWLTPIMWNIDTIDIPGVLKMIFKLNPMYYIVQGYRDSLINGIWFFERLELTAYFWTFTILVFVFGKTVFKRLKPHFADVL